MARRLPPISSSSDNPSSVQTTSFFFPSSGNPVFFLHSCSLRDFFFLRASSQTKRLVPEAFGDISEKCLPSSFSPEKGVVGFVFLCQCIGPCRHRERTDFLGCRPPDFKCLLSPALSFLFLADKRTMTRCLLSFAFLNDDDLAVFPRPPRRRNFESNAATFLSVLFAGGFSSFFLDGRSHLSPAAVPPSLFDPTETKSSCFCL